MGQMMGLVVFFNLPMPYSLILLLIIAALIEEMAKAIGIYTLFVRDPSFFSWKNLSLPAPPLQSDSLSGKNSFSLQHFPRYLCRSSEVFSFYR